MFPNVSLGALLEALQRGFDLNGFLLCPLLASLHDDVDAGYMAIAFHAQARGVACQAGLLQRHLVEGAEAVPALLAVEPVAVTPVLRTRAGDHQIEATPGGIFPGGGFPLDIEG